MTSLIDQVKKYDYLRFQPAGAVVDGYQAENYLGDGVIDGVWALCGPYAALSNLVDDETETYARDGNDELVAVEGIVTDGPDNSVQIRNPVVVARFSVGRLRLELAQWTTEDEDGGVTIDWDALGL